MGSSITNQTTDRRITPMRTMNPAIQFLKVQSTASFYFLSFQGTGQARHHQPHWEGTMLGKCPWEFGHCGPMMLDNRCSTGWSGGWCLGGSVVMTLEHHGADCTCFATAALFLGDMFTSDSKTTLQTPLETLMLSGWLRGSHNFPAWLIIFRHLLKKPW